ncbi:hypothetical protein BDZ45DRAFT_761256 [Acephala macrosclerotiorum]|nr:hypothetical protein BDZ45DRAFT_761256 [Acephala macrosclerotiorum]
MLRMMSSHRPPATPLCRVVVHSLRKQNRRTPHDRTPRKNIFPLHRLDILSLMVASRPLQPNPQGQLGEVDCSSAIVVCDLTQCGEPIVYINPTFVSY